VNNATTLVLLTTIKKEGTRAPLSNTMSFPKFNGEHPRVWRDKCLYYFTLSLFNIHKSLWVTDDAEGNALWYQAYSIWLRHVILPWTAPGYLGPLLLRYLPKQTNSFMISSEGNRLFVLMD
jgi:hypothetical protein